MGEENLLLRCVESLYSIDETGSALSKSAQVVCLPVSVGGDYFTVRCAFWRSGGDGSRGTFCLFQGRGEFIEQYYGMIDRLLGLGYSVAALDWCGQGGSCRFLSDLSKGHVEDFSYFDAVLDCFMGRVFSEFSGPFYSFAHSTGGLVVLRSVLRGEAYFSRLVFSAPLLFFGSCRRHWGLVRGAMCFLRFLGFGNFYVPLGRSRSGIFSPFVDNVYTGDEAQFEYLRDLARHADDLVIGSPTIGWMDSSFRAMKDFMSVMESGSDYHARFSSFSGKICIIFGSDDRVVSLGMLRLLGDHFPLLTLHEISDGRHVLLYERTEISEQFWHHVMAFMDH